jgi:hypothetical protein
MGSHEAMEKQHNMPANAASDKACTFACVNSDWLTAERQLKELSQGPVAQKARSAAKGK